MLKHKITPSEMVETFGLDEPTNQNTALFILVEHVLFATFNILHRISL